MKVRCVSFAFVSAAYLAAFATISGTAYASPSEANSALVRKAYVTLQSGDAQGAVGEYSDAIASDLLEPELLANALLNRALAYQQLGDHAAALADYNAAIKLNIMAPALRSTALYNRGLAYQKAGEVTKSIEDFTAALLINPKFAQAYYSRANALRDSGQLLFALSDYERALQYGHPNKAKVHYGSATAYLALKRPLDAKREFNSALNLDPSFGQARAQLVMLGDENAQLQTTEADPILTGSVGAYSGGTDVTKPGAPAAVDVPGELQAAFDKKLQAPNAIKAVAKAKIADRLPDQTSTPVLALADEAVADTDNSVAIDQVPAIPEPETNKVASAPEVESETIESEAPPQLSGWAVQIASAASEDAAWSTWKKMQARHKVLKSKNPAVVKADLGAKGIFYRVRLGGFAEQESAKTACAKLKASGVNCYISKASN
jgi:tetratricopeptide (TPR) repeat protein